MVHPFIPCCLAFPAALVARLRHEHQLYVWAVGDSPLDLNMLCAADQAIVVVGEEHTRSKTMDAALLSAVDNGGLRARQALLPSNAPPRLDVTKLPLVQITEREFVDSVLRQSRHAGIRVHHATDRNAANLLMTPMRDAKVAGPALRKAHHDAGRYLAVEFLSDVIGIEEYQISHVQGHSTSGHRLFHENQTLIVALMRGGEPMASGVNEVFPLATLVHANNPNDMTQHLQGRSTVVIVDSVVNTPFASWLLLALPRPSRFPFLIRHWLVRRALVLLLFVFLKTSSPAAAPPTLATVSSTRRIYPSFMI